MGQLLQHPNRAVRLGAENVLRSTFNDWVEHGEGNVTLLSHLLNTAASQFWRKILEAEDAQKKRR